MKEPVAVQDLHFSYGEKEILKGLSFEIRPGEILGILGPNASGKTTLIKNLAGLLTPSRGVIRIGSRELSSLPRNERARSIAFVPQGEEPFLPFSVEQIVMMGRAPYLGLWGFESEADRKKAQDAMADADVHHLRDRRFSDLSGGERQRVILARALAQEASLLLLDEPTSHLDLHYQIQLLELCARLNREQKITVVLSIHDLNLACLYGHRLLILKEGGLFALGEPRGVMTSAMIRTVYETDASIGFHTDSGLPYTLPIRLAPAKPDASAQNRGENPDSPPRYPPSG